jgi:hypothetical protein
MDMATIGSINIGVSASTAGLSKGLSRARSQVQGFSQQVLSLGSVARIAAGAFAGFSVVGAIKKAVTAASDLNEQVSKSQQVFGAASQVVESAAQRMADSFGIPKTQFIEAASSIGLIAKGAGLSQAAAADLGAQFGELGADVSSFYNVSLDEALGAIRSGLVGESEPLRRFGVLLNESAVQAEAARLGIAAMGAKLTEAQKVQARSSLITKGLATAHGDLARTSDGVANRIRSLGGRLENLAADAGTALLPVTNVFLGLADTLVGQVLPAIVPVTSAISSGFLDVINTVGPGLEAIGERLMSFPDLVTNALGPGTIGFLGEFGAALKADVLNALDLVGVAWRNLPDFVDIAAIKINEIVTNIGAYIATIPENLGIIANYISNNWRELVTDAISAVGTAFDNLGKNIGELANSIYQFLKDPTQGFQFNFTPLLEGFKATAAELPALVGPELVSFQDQIDAKIAAIGEREAARAQEMADSAAEKVKPAAVAAKAAEVATAAPIGKSKSEKLLAGAAELGSTEAHSSIAKFRAGGTDPIKSLDKTNKDQLAELRGLRADLRRGKGDAPKVLSLAG